LVGYRFYDAKNIKPLYEFGYGLSYTEFIYSNLSITGNNFAVKVSLDIKNTGNMDGSEIAQLYLGFP